MGRPRKDLYVQTSSNFETYADICSCGEVIVTNQPKHAPRRKVIRCSGCLARIFTPRPFVPSRRLA